MAERHPTPWLATNWKKILAVDAGLVGGGMVVAGLLVMVAWSVPVGAAVGAAGLVYVVMIARRAAIWRRRRREAGLG